MPKKVPPSTLEYATCPRCKNKKNSGFMRSVYSDSLFKKLSRGEDFKRNFLFCKYCIDSAMDEFKGRSREPQPGCSTEAPRYSPISEASASRSTPDPFLEAMADTLPSSALSDISPTSSIGMRLAGFSGSPVHLGFPPLVPIDSVLERDEMEKDETEMDTQPLPSTPTNDMDPWEINEEVHLKRKINKK